MGSKREVAFLLARYAEELNLDTFHSLKKELEEKALLPCSVTSLSRETPESYEYLRNHKNIDFNEMLRVLGSCISTRVRAEPNENALPLLSDLYVSSKVLKNRMKSLAFRSYHNRGSYKGHFFSIYCVSFDRTGSRIITGSDDGLVKIWNATSFRLLRTLYAHTGYVCDLSIDFTNTRLVTIGIEGIMCLWDLATGTLLCTHVVQQAVHTVEFYPGEQRKSMCVYTTADYNVVLCSWENDAYTQVSIFQCQTSEENTIHCASFTPGGELFIVGDTNGLIRIIDVFNTTKQRVVPIDAHEGAIECVHVSSNTLDFATSGNDKVCKYWTHEAGAWTPTLLDHAGASITMVCVLCVSNYVVTTADDFKIRIWHGCSLHKEIAHHTMKIPVIVCHPIVELFATAGADGRVVVWTLNGEQVSSFAVENAAFINGQFSPCGMHLCVTDNDGRFFVFSVFSEEDSGHTTPREQFFLNDFYYNQVDINTNLAAKNTPYATYDLHLKENKPPTAEEITLCDAVHQRELEIERTQLKALRNREIAAIEETKFVLNNTVNVRIMKKCITQEVYAAYCENPSTDDSTSPSEESVVSSESSSSTFFTDESSKETNSAEEESDTENLELELIADGALILDWLLIDTPRSVPYRPQCGDKVIYFQKGHEAFIRSYKLFSEQEVAKQRYMHFLVKAISYELHPVRHMRLTLVDDGYVFELRYFEPTNLSDVVVLEETVERARCDLHTGEEVSVLYNEGVYRGIVVDVDRRGRVTKNEHCYNRISVKVYSDNADDTLNVIKCSPWELGRRAPYSSRITHTHRRFLIKRIKKIRQIALFGFFETQEVLYQCEGYLDTIAYPISIELIQTRIFNGYYRQLQAIIDDAHQLLENTRTYNGDGSYTEVARAVYFLIREVVLRPKKPLRLLDYYEQHGDEILSKLEEGRSIARLLKFSWE